MRHLIIVFKGENMVDPKVQKIISQHAERLGKRINVRAVVLIDPSNINPYEGPFAVYAPGMLHITTDKLATLMSEFEFDTEKFLKNIILKDEDKIPRTIYISTNTRRIFIRFLKIPNKNLDLIKPADRNMVKKEFVYYLGISIMKNPESVGMEEPFEKPQEVFDSIDLLIKDLEKVL